MAPAMMMIAQTVLSYPTAIPWMMLVAWPVRQLLASDLTGLYSVLVQYSVQKLSTTARIMPMRQVYAARMSRPSLSGTYSWARTQTSVSLSTTLPFSITRSLILALLISICFSADRLRQAAATAARSASMIAGTASATI